MELEKCLLYKAILAPTDQPSLGWIGGCPPAYCGEEDTSFTGYLFYMTLYYLISKDKYLFFYLKIGRSIYARIGTPIVQSRLLNMIFLRKVQKQSYNIRQL